MTYKYPDTWDTVDSDEAFASLFEGRTVEQCTLTMPEGLPDTHGFDNWNHVMFWRLSDGTVLAQEIEAMAGYYAGDTELQESWRVIFPLTEDVTG